MTAHSSTQFKHVGILDRSAEEWPSEKKVLRKIRKPLNHQTGTIQMQQWICTKIITKRLRIKEYLKEEKSTCCFAIYRWYKLFLHLFSLSLCSSITNNHNTVRPSVQRWANRFAASAFRHAEKTQNKVSLLQPLHCSLPCQGTRTQEQECIKRLKAIDRIEDHHPAFVIHTFARKWNKV